MIFLCLRRNYKPLCMHSTHGAFSRGIKFNVTKLYFCTDWPTICFADIIGTVNIE